MRQRRRAFRRLDEDDEQSTLLHQNPQSSKTTKPCRWVMATRLNSAALLRVLPSNTTTLIRQKPLHSLDKPAMALKMATASIGLLLLAAQARAQSSSTTKKPAGTVTVYGSCGTPTSTLFPPLFSYAPMSSKTSTATMSTYIPTVSDVPTCAQGCVGDLGGCAMGDVRCICSNSSYMTGVAACVSRSCPFGQCQRE